jgi:eukaryotic-like serine/threonine-protein kinase
VAEAVTISSVARMDDERWLIAGRTERGSLPPPDSRGSWPGACSFAAIYRPLDWALETVQAPAGRALLATASRPERKLAIAVGAEGSTVRVERDQISCHQLPDAPDLASVAIDVLGNEWAAGAGSVWSSRGRDRWKRAWENSTWQAPFVSLLAETGLVVAMTVDGGVLECRSSVFDPTKPA